MSVHSVLHVFYELTHLEPKTPVLYIQFHPECSPRMGFFRWDTYSFVPEVFTLLAQACLSFYHWINFVPGESFWLCLSMQVWDPCTKSYGTCETEFGACPAKPWDVSGIVRSTVAEVWISILFCFPVHIWHLSAKFWQMFIAHPYHGIRTFSSAHVQYWGKLTM